MKRCTRDHQVHAAADPVLGLRWLKSSEQHGKHRRGSLGCARDRLFRLRATSAVARDKSVRRSAQDDDFVGALAKNIQSKLALMRTYKEGRSRKKQGLALDFVGAWYVDPGEADRIGL
jgi:hypothetical protein